MDAFDADVLVYATVAGHSAGRRVRALFPSEPVDESQPPVGCGSMLLVSELLTRSVRDEASDEIAELAGLLGRLELLPVDRSIAQLATALGAAYGLRASDAIHLATAVGAGAERFITNNRGDFPKSIAEIDITYPSDLDDPGHAWGDRRQPPPRRRH